MNNERDERESLKKASSLDGDSLSFPTGKDIKGNKKSKDKQSHRALKSGRRSIWRSILADLLILLVLAGLGLGVWFGYNALKDIYAPVWEERNVELCIKMVDIDYDRADELWEGLDNHPLWYTDAADGICLGSVTEVRLEPSTTSTGKAVMTLYLTVSVTAQYRNSDGYYVGDVRLLAGEGGIYRTNGLVAEGTIISLTDPQISPETQAPETDTQAEEVSQ